MSVDRLRKIEQRIEKLKAQKDRITALDKTRNRKLLTKQKVLIGEHMLSKSIPRMEVDKRLSFFNTIRETIPFTRKSDLHAIDALIEEYQVEETETSVNQSEGVSDE